MLVKTPFLPFLFAFNFAPLLISFMFVFPFLKLHDMYYLSFFLIVFTQHFLYQDKGEILYFIFF